MSEFRIIDGYYAPTKHQPRIERYTRFNNILKGDLESAFNPVIPENSFYIQEQFGQLLSFTSADYLFGESQKLLFSAEEDTGQQFIDDFMLANSGFKTSLHESAVSCSATGDVVVEMKLSDSGVAQCVFHDTRNWIPVFDALGNIEAHELCFYFEANGSKYVRKRIHRKGLVENKLFEIQEQTTGFGPTKKSTDVLVRVPFTVLGSQYSNIAEEEQVPFEDDFLVHQIPNMRSLNSVYGISDYAGKETLMAALSQLTSFAHSILEKHSDPAIEVPEGTLDENRDVYDQELKVFQTNGETAGIPKYVVWDGQLPSLFDQRQHVIDMLALYSEMSMGVLGKADGGAIPESARALKLKFARTLQKMARKKRYWDEGIQFIFRVGQKLKGIDPSPITIEFPDGLPDDELAYLEEKVLERDLGVTSNETLIEEVGSRKGWSQEQIENEKQRLLSQEKRSSLGSTSPAPQNIFERTVEPQDVNGTPEDN